jgi:hypothetical protein
LIIDNIDVLLKHPLPIAKYQLAYQHKSNTVLASFNYIIKAPQGPLLEVMALILLTV